MTQEIFSCNEDMNIQVKLQSNFILTSEICKIKKTMDPFPSDFLKIQLTVYSILFVSKWVLFRAMMSKADTLADTTTLLHLIVSRIRTKVQQSPVPYILDTFRVTHNGRV